MSKTPDEVVTWAVINSATDNVERKLRETFNKILNKWIDKNENEVFVKLDYCT